MSKGTWLCISYLTLVFCRNANATERGGVRSRGRRGGQGHEPDENIGRLLTQDNIARDEDTSTPLFVHRGIRAQRPQLRALRVVIQKCGHGGRIRDKSPFAFGGQSAMLGEVQASAVAWDQMDSSHSWNLNCRRSHFNFTEYSESQESNLDTRAAELDRA